LDKQKTLIEEVNWNTLVILDAMRYDYFENMYNDYLTQGRLTKVETADTHTLGWLKKTFNNYTNAVYISGNPLINSKGVSREGYVARDHFSKIVDVWDDGWNWTLGTTDPEKVTLEAVKHTGQEKRLIVHYIQPHAPYYSLTGLPKRSGRVTDSVANKGEGVGTLRFFVNNYVERLERPVGNVLRKTLGNRRVDTLNYLYSRLKEKLGVEPKGPIAIAVETVGEERLKDAYRDNCERVLNEASKLIESTAGKVIVTSDHGDLLGEGGRYGHPGGDSHSVLKEVPWLEI